MIKIISNNKKAYHDYEILEKVEAGLVLVGTEVKALRAGSVRMSEAYVWPVGGELFIQNMFIPEYKQGNINNHVPTRDRKLLIKKREAERLMGKVKEKGLNIVPLKLYFKGSWVKIELGLGRGKKLYDKRDSLRKKEMDRDKERALRERG